MKILILGYGKEGTEVERYFKEKGEKPEILTDFTDEDLKKINFEKYDYVFRSPSVRPIKNSWSSSTKYFFDNVKCKVIGVTGTKGKGTTCTIISKILEGLGKKVYLVGNIGTPAISKLDEINKEDVVVYEMSSFQLWDMEKSPSISVVLRIEPDHLNVHKDMDEYVSAKSNITAYQNIDDACVYFDKNDNTKKAVKASKAKKYPYPIKEKSKELKQLLELLSLPGDHNKENCEAALLACSAYFKEDLDDFLIENYEKLAEILSNIHGLPHRMEYLRTIDGIDIYDDNFSTTLPSLEVAINSFPKKNQVLIMGGRDKTDFEDIPELLKLLETHKNVKKIILIGELGAELYKNHRRENFVFEKTLKDAVNTALKEAKAENCNVIIMSPAAASFDMFNNVYDRGEQYQNMVKNL